MYGSRRLASETPQPEYKSTPGWQVRLTSHFDYIFYYRALTDIYLYPPSLFIHFPSQCSSALSLSFPFPSSVKHLLTFSFSTLNCARRDRKYELAIEQHYQSVILVRFISNCSIISFICYYSCWRFLLLFSIELFSFSLSLSPFLVCLFLFLSTVCDNIIKLLYWCSFSLNIELSLSKFMWLGWAVRCFLSEQGTRTKLSTVNVRTKFCTSEL